MIRRISIVLIMAIVLFCTAKAGAQPVIFQEPLSPRMANYDIDVKLDAKTKVFHAKERLTWHNKTGATITELPFHLYLNAFRNTHSSFMKEMAGRKESPEKIKLAKFGYIEVESIKLASGEDLKPKMEFIHPDDDNAEDRTVFKVPLSKPLVPGETIVVNIEFTGRLPEPPVARNGSKDEYFFFGQWFPKIGVYIDGKWNCHQYHSHTEFFADYGVYNVKITVPEKNLVGATGIQVSRTSNGDGTATHFYHAEDVHDFAWTTSPNFVEVKGKQNNVEIRVLIQKKRQFQGQRHLDAAKLAVKYFESWYGDYPYPNLTVVDPRPGAFETAGMEYPTLITAGTLTILPKGVREVEMVIIHEFGHNYWYHLVGNNEFEESWLDEGINTYSEIQIMHDIYGAKGSMIDWLGLKGDDMQLRRFDYVNSPDFDPIVRNGWQYYNGASYTSNSYSKPGLMLITLENYLGKETMNKVMREWLARFRFKHPHSQDFVKVACEVSGQDLNWFFNQAIYSNVILDYAVTDASSKEIKQGQGYDITYTPEKEPEKSAAKAGKGSSDSKKDKLYLSVVKVRRLGQFQFPVEVEMVFANGDKLREKWDGKDTWTEFRYVKPVKLVSAAVDPDHKVVLDINWKNNKRTVKQGGGGGRGGYVQMVKFAINPQ